MQNSKTIPSLPKRLYAFVIIMGFIIISVIGYSLYSGVKTNKIHAFLVNAAMEIKYRSTAAHIKLDDYLQYGNIESLKDCWNDLDSADYSINIILYDRNLEGGFLFPLIEDDLKKDLTNLKTILSEYKESAKKKIERLQSRNGNSELETEFNEKYQALLNAAMNVKEKLNYVMKDDLDNFIVMHYVLIGISIIIMLFVVSTFIVFDKHRAKAIIEIQKTNQQLEKEIRGHNLAQEALQESEMRLTRLIGNLPGTVYRCKDDENRTMLFISEGCINITGYKPEDFTGDEKISYPQIIHPEDQQNVKEQIAKSLANRKPFQLVYRIITAPGFEKWVWEQGVGVFSDRGFVISIEGFIIDITEQRNAESQLLLLSTALETAANGIMITDAEGNIVWINAAFTKMTGYTSREVFGRNANMLKSGRHNQSYYRELWDTINSGEVWRGELINQRKNGSLYDEEITISPVKDTMGRISHFIGIKHDITERKHADKALVESEERFRGLYENATIGLYQASLDGKILMANSTMIKMLGFKTFEDLHFVDIERGYTNQEQRKEFKERIKKEGIVFGFESAWRRSDRNIIYVRESARAIKDDNENILFLEGTVEDITERKRAEYALIEAKEKAEKSDMLKTEFLAQMSHEIRTPINALLSFSTMIREEVEDKVDEDLKEGFKIIDLEGKRVIRTVDLILNMAQIQTDSYTPFMQMVDLYSDVISAYYDEYEPLANEKGLKFLMMKKTDNTFVMADEYSVKQIFTNLIDNAIKYTNKGKVEIIIERDDDERVLVHIVDSGIGISREYQNILFTPFTQEEHGYSRKFDGNGLGLALVKKYCEMNNAEIKVNSEKGKGSTFTVIFST